MARETATFTLLSSGIEQLREENPVKEGRVAPKTLFTGDDVRVVHLALDTELAEHRAPSPIVVQVVEGKVRFDVEGEEHLMGVGGLIHVAPGVPHAVTPIDGLARILIHLIAPSAHETKAGE